MIKLLFGIFSWFKCLFSMPKLWATQWSELSYLRQHLKTIAETHQNLVLLLGRKTKVNCGVLFIGMGPGNKPFLCGRRHRILPGETIQDRLQPDCELKEGFLVAWGPCAIVEAVAYNNSLSVWHSASMPAVMVPPMTPAQVLNYILKADEAD